MNQMDIRNILESRVQEFGGKVTMAGFMAVAPFTMDFDFTLDGKDYYVTLVDGEESRKVHNVCKEEKQCF